MSPSTRRSVEDGEGACHNCGLAARARCGVALVRFRGSASFLFSRCAFLLRFGGFVVSWRLVVLFASFRSGFRVWLLAVLCRFVHALASFVHALAFVCALVFLFTAFCVFVHAFASFF